MTEYEEQVSSAFPGSGLAQQVPESVLHLKSALASGTVWYQALLEAVGMWTLPQEVHQGRNYQYLIRGEAFDWLLLAERLCDEMGPAIPPDDRETLLFTGRLPPEVTSDIFRELIGVTKHRAHLNYWYGVVLEEALQLAVEEEVRKRHRARCYPDSEDLIEEAFTHLYAKNRTQLLAEFKKQANSADAFIFESGDTDEPVISLTELKEFTYWLFKHRVNYWDPARVASDTRKAMRRLSGLEVEEPQLVAVVPAHSPF